MSAKPLRYNGIACSGCGKRFPSVREYDNPENHAGACTGDAA